VVKPQLELWAKCGQASQGTVPRQPGRRSGRKPNRKMAIFKILVTVKILLGFVTDGGCSYAVNTTNYIAQPFLVIYAVFMLLCLQLFKKQGSLLTWNC